MGTVCSPCTLGKYGAGGAALAQLGSGWRPCKDVGRRYRLQRGPVGRVRDDQALPGRWCWRPWSSSTSSPADEQALDVALAAVVAALGSSTQRGTTVDVRSWQPAPRIRRDDAPRTRAPLWWPPGDARPGRRDGPPLPGAARRPGSRSASSRALAVWFTESSVPWITSTGALIEGSSSQASWPWLAS